MRIRNRRYGYTQTDWPVNIGTTHNGAACYDMDPDLAAVWRSIGTNEDLKPVHTQLQQSDTTDS